MTNMVFRISSAKWRRQCVKSNIGNCDTRTCITRELWIFHDAYIRRHAKRSKQAIMIYYDSCYRWLHTFTYDDFTYTFTDAINDSCPTIVSSVECRPFCSSFDVLRYLKENPRRHYEFGFPFSLTWWSSFDWCTYLSIRALLRYIVRSNWTVVNRAL